MSFPLPDVICHGPREWVRALNEHGWFTSTTEGVPEDVLDRWCSAARAAVVIDTPTDHPVVARMMRWRDKRQFVVLRPVDGVDVPHVAMRLRTLLGTPQLTGEPIPPPQPTHPSARMLQQILRRRLSADDAAHTVHVRGPGAALTIQQAWASEWIARGPWVRVPGISAESMLTQIASETGDGADWHAVATTLHATGTVLWIEGVESAQTARRFSDVVKEHLRGVTVVVSSNLRWPDHWLVVEAPARPCDPGSLAEVVDADLLQRLWVVCDAVDGAISSRRLADALGLRLEATGDLLHAAAQHGVLIETAECAHPRSPWIPDPALRRAWLANPAVPAPQVAGTLDTPLPFEDTRWSRLVAWALGSDGDPKTGEAALTVVRALSGSVHERVAAAELISPLPPSLAKAAAASLIWSSTLHEDRALRVQHAVEGFAAVGAYREQLLELLELAHGAVQSGDEEEADALRRRAEALAVQLGVFRLRALREDTGVSPL